MLTGRKLLLADDSAAIRKVIELTFSDEGMEVITVADGRSAFEKMVQVVPDLVLADVYMPEVDGFSFLKNFKDLPDLVKNKSKIVVLTSSNSAKDRSQAFTFPNVIQFITKPLKQSDIEDLKKLINHSEFTGQANL